MNNLSLIQIETLGKQIITIAMEARTQKNNEMAVNAICDLIGDLQEIVDKEL